MEKVFEIKGYIHVDDDDVKLFEEIPVKNEYGWYDCYGPSLGYIISEHFLEVSKKVTLTVSDWTRGETQIIDSVFCQYYISHSKTNWDDIKEQDLRQQLGVLQTEDRYDGYSEYTITDSWTDIFIGGHDLREELKSHDSEYVIIRIRYNIKD